MEDGSSRRTFIKSGLAAGFGTLASGLWSLFGQSDTTREAAGQSAIPNDSGDVGRETMDMITMGEVDHRKNGFDPIEMLTDWDQGSVSTLPGGQTLREYKIVAVDKVIEVAPGVEFNAWTYEGRVPGPTLRCTEGDRVRVEFVNAGTHPHTIHFHGIHDASMDGVPGAGDGQIEPGESTVYEFDAEPFGCHFYHCHSTPLKRHIHKGLYGTFIVDPDPAKHPDHVQAARSRLLGTPENEQWQELMMIMNGFDTNFDGDNEIYAANSIAFTYANNPIKIDRNRPVRLYLVNATEFDPVNSLHLHANFFDFYDHGTTLVPDRTTIDTVMMCQAQRGILEFSFEDFELGKYMFHAHQSEFAELGWMSFFEVTDGEAIA